MSEPREIMIKRLQMRSMRRGIKEMDLILSAFATSELSAMSDADLRLYDALLGENDHDLYAWIGGQFEVPEPYALMIGRIAAMAEGVTKPT